MIPLRSLLEQRSTMCVDVSRDGETLLLESDRPGTTQLFTVGARGGEPEQLTQYTEPVHGQLVPGTSRVLLERDEGGNERIQLHVLDATPRHTEPVVADPRFIHRGPVVSSDGRLLAYATNRRNGVDFDVVVRVLATGEERALVEQGGSWDAFGFSPDGRWLAASLATARAGDNDLYLADLRDGTLAHVSQHDGEAYIGRPAWLPDASGFFAASSIGRDKRALTRYELVRGSWSTVLESRWDLECRLDDAGTTLLVEANDDGYSRLELRDPGTLELRAEVPLPGRGVVEHAVLAPDGSRVYVSFSSPLNAADVWAYDVGAGDLERLTESPADVPRERLVEPELHRFASFDGESIPVFLWRPDGDGPFPVVVGVHGGPESQFRPGFLPSFTPLTQHLVSRGYAVAAPNVRGSTGYGKRFEHLDDRRLRVDSVRDLACLHDWLSSRPEIDGKRAVLYGRSYGGYMVLAGLAFQPERWAAGIEAVGISSLVTFLENTSAWRRAVREREYGWLDRDRDFLVEASPLTHVGQIRAPLFIQHGANDPRVPVSEAQQIHASLTARGVRCELVVYEDEGHTIGKLENRVDAFERAVRFLEAVVPR